MACDDNCKVIGQAVIGTSFKIGCDPVPCPPANNTFSATARKGTSGVQKYRNKFRKLGLNI